MNLKAFLIMGLVLCIITISGCTSDPDNFKTKHFENENISFDYPENWEVTITPNPADSPDANWMIKIEDNVLINDENANIDILIIEFTPNDLVNNSLINNSTGNQINSIKIDNITAQGISVDKYTKMYIFSKNNMTYEITAYAVGPDDTFELYKSQFDTILNSIQIK